MKENTYKRRIASRKRNRIVLTIKIVVAIGVIAFLFTSRRLDVTAILNSYKYSDSLLLGVLFCILAMIIPMFRWWILTRMQRLPLGAFDTIRLNMIGDFFNIFIPGGSGGDVIRAAYAIREFPERRAQALAVAFVDRGLGLHALLLLSVCLFSFQPHLLDTNPGIWPLVLFVTGLLIVGTLSPLLLLLERTKDIVARLFGRVLGGVSAWKETMELYRHQPGLFFLAYAFSIGIALSNILAIHFMMLAVGSTPTVFESLSIAPLVILANCLPLTPGGVGIAEGTSAGLYALMGHVGGANGMLLTRFFIIMFALLGLPFFLMNREVRSKGIPAKRI